MKTFSLPSSLSLLVKLVWEIMNRLEQEKCVTIFLKSVIGLLLGDSFSQIILSWFFFFNFDVSFYINFMLYIKRTDSIQWKLIYIRSEWTGLKISLQTEPKLKPLNTHVTLIQKKKKKTRNRGTKKIKNKTHVTPTAKICPLQLLCIKYWYWYWFVDPKNKRDIDFDFDLCMPWLSSCIFKHNQFTNFRNSS